VGRLERVGVRLARGVWRKGGAAAALAAALTLAAPAPRASEAVTQGASVEKLSMDAIAESYVKLALALGQHDADYVDAYYGPPQWQTEAQAARLPLDAIRQRARAALAALPALAPPADDTLATLRHEYLLKQLGSLASRVEMLEGRRFGFDEESQALYDAVAPHHPESEFRETLARLAEALPGDAALRPRYEAFRKGLEIPTDRLDAVFREATRACRERTLKHLQLPASESFRIEYVRDKPWGGYNWYQGGYRSLIQVNTDLPVAIDRAIDLACHEGYPGHHVYNVLLEQHLVRERGFVEFSVYPLFSPQSLIAEGTANFGIEVAFPGDERLRYEREVLFPLAGIDPGLAEANDRVRELVAQLGYVGNEAARGLIDGTLDAEAARSWLMELGLMSRERAEQRLRFVERYRSYVINYNLGQDLVRAYVEREGGTADRPERRWQVFSELLASPRLPSGLR
jgi:hypothetical protein